MMEPPGGQNRAGHRIAQKPGGGDCRQRELFPLPLPFAPEAVLPGPSRSVRRRLLRKRHWQTWCNEGVATLNSLSGFPGPPGSFLRDIHCAALDHISEAYRAVHRPPALSSEGALRELLGASVCYDADSFEKSTYSEENISWPCAGIAPVLLERCLPSADFALLNGWRSQLLRDPSETHALLLESEIRSPYSDPVLQGGLQ